MTRARTMSQRAQIMSASPVVWITERKIRGSARRDDVDEMTTIRIATRKRFTVVERAVINDQRLSFRARGVLFWLLDKPDNWTSDSNAISRAGKEGRDAVRAALTELEECGYLSRERKQIEGGRWVTEVCVRESPTPENPSSVEELSTGQPAPGLPTSESQALSTEDCLTNTDGLKAENPLFDSGPVSPPWVDRGMTYHEWSLAESETA